jgi:hypothetical protein
MAALRHPKKKHMQEQIRGTDVLPLCRAQVAYIWAEGLTVAPAITADARNRNLSVTY